MNKETARAAGKVVFNNDYLDGSSTINTYLKEILKEVIYNQEGFSGKRPFGNSDWMSVIEKALVEAGFLKDPKELVEHLLCDIVNSW